jgi:hypothetical protein
MANGIIVFYLSFSCPQHLSRNSMYAGKGIVAIEAQKSIQFVNFYIFNLLKGNKLVELPARAGIVEHAENYLYSSAGFY